MLDLLNIDAKRRRMRPCIVCDNGGLFVSRGAHVEICSSIGQGGGRLMIRLKGVVPESDELGSFRHM